MSTSISYWYLQYLAHIGPRPISDAKAITKHKKWRIHMKGVSECDVAFFLVFMFSLRQKYENHKKTLEGIAKIVSGIPRSWFWELYQPWRYPDRRHRPGNVPGSTPDLWALGTSWRSITRATGSREDFFVENERGRWEILPCTLIVHYIWGGAALILTLSTLFLHYPVPNLHL